MTPRTRAKRKPAQDNGQEMTEEKAQEFLQAQNRLRAEQAKVEIQKILDQYQCQIQTYPVIIDGLIRATAEIVAVRNDASEND
jgi:hypothetical protein